MGKRRTPANFPRMKHRAAKRRAPRLSMWDSDWNLIASSYTRGRPDVCRLGNFTVGRLEPTIPDDATTVLPTRVGTTHEVTFTDVNPELIALLGGGGGDA